AGHARARASAGIGQAYSRGTTERARLPPGAGLVAFIGYALSREGAKRAGPSARPIDDAALRQVVRRELDRDPVAFEDADIVFPHSAGDVRGDDVPVVELHAKGRVR